MSSTTIASRSRSLVLRAATTSTHAVRARKPRVTSHSQQRHYAQVGPTTYVGNPPAAPATGLTPHQRPGNPSTPSAIRPFDAEVIAELQQVAARQSRENVSPASTSATALTSTPASLTDLVEEYMKRAGNVLDASLPYESRPDVARRVQFSKDAQTHADASTADGALVMVAHAVHDRTGKHKVAYSSGFAVHAPGIPEGQSVFVTCAHTLEEVSPAW